jgi:hypothetical protein
MFGPGDSRSAGSLSELERSELRIVYGHYPWSGAVIVGVVAAITSPAWLFFPPHAPSESPDRIRIIALAIGVGMSAMAWAAVRKFGPRLLLDLPGKTASLTIRTPWRTRVEWELKSEQVSEVTVGRGGGGVVYVQATRKQGGILTVDQGIAESQMRRLGADLARCWRVPLKGLSDIS